MASSSIESPPLLGWLRRTDASLHRIGSIYSPQHNLLFYALLVTFTGPGDHGFARVCAGANPADSRRRQDAGAGGDD
ncbi:MAG: hypothetical protein ACLP3C_07770 [Mycobacterium sp.]|uniref:hypothetical protein n=1 Tax=Mycobacterium sp. TaxID=1785 RepID=UPI003F956885